MTLNFIHYYLYQGFFRISQGPFFCPIPNAKTLLFPNFWDKNPIRIFVLAILSSEYFNLMPYVDKLSKAMSMGPRALLKVADEISVIQHNIILNAANKYQTLNSQTV